MTDRLSEALDELQEKSPFICTSCGHPHDIPKVHLKRDTKTNTKFHDRFSDAILEEGEKTAFKCESCGKHQVVVRRGVH